MQFIPFCLFTIICGYSLVLSAPVNQAVPDSQETKHQKATAIASRLLKELAGEHGASQQQQQQESSSNQHENQDTIIPVNRPAIEKVQSHIGGANNGFHDDEDEEEIDFIPTLEDIYEMYGDKYAQLADDEESASEDIDDDDAYVLPGNEEQLLRYLAEQEESDEHLTPVIHTPVMDDSIMTAEDHQRRRRRAV